MSEQIFSLIVTVSVIALMVAWVLFIFVCPLFGRALERHWLKKVEEGKRRVFLANHLLIRRSWPVESSEIPD
jgi:hypothetical protein